MPIAGKWYNREQSREYSAELVIHDDQHCLIHLKPPPGSSVSKDVPRLSTTQPSTDVIAEAHLSELTISERLASLPRRLAFPNSGLFVTEDNEAIDQHLRSTDKLGKKPGFNWPGKIHAMETSFSIALICLVLLIVSVFAVSQYGIPYLANKVSQHLPKELITQLNDATLEQLDDGFLLDSELPIERQQQLSHYFSQFDATERVIEFRKGSKAIGANAFALPGSTIIFTDQMIALAKHDEELLSIYFHEAGHIDSQHSIRSVLQSSAIALFITFITGDGSGIAESLYAIPIILAHSAYSRKFEAEADDHAHAMMLAHDIPLNRFADIMSRLEQQYSDEGDQDKVMGYFSSHPETADRIRQFSK